MVIQFLWKINFFVAGDTNLGVLRPFPMGQWNLGFLHVSMLSFPSEKSLQPLPYWIVLRNRLIPHRVVPLWIQYTWGLLGSRWVGLECGAVWYRTFNTRHCACRHAPYPSSSLPNHLIATFNNLVYELRNVDVNFKICILCLSPYLLIIL